MQGNSVEKFYMAAYSMNRKIDNPLISLNFLYVARSLLINIAGPQIPRPLKRCKSILEANMKEDMQGRPEAGTFWALL